MIEPIPATCQAEWVFKRYETIRRRMPRADFPSTSLRCNDLGELIDLFDVFLFDSFGVLNVGDTPIPGAKQRLQALRQAGKSVAVLTNAATGPLSGLVGKYARLGLDFSRHEIISSREILSNALKRFDQSMNWGVAAPEAAHIEELGVNATLLGPDHTAFERADGFILLSSQRWNVQLQDMLLTALNTRKRPLLVGNPDLAAPREDGFSLEPGTFAHALADQCDLEPEFFGKPFGNAFEEAIQRLAGDVPRKRIAMIGDTLHTDILGGAAAGLGTILVTAHGMLQSMDVADCIAASGIIPGHIMPHI